MKKVYLVRHGETTYNLNELVQDGSSLLTERGQEQARVVAARLATLNFQHLLVSDYERTKQTAAPTIELTGLTPVYTPLFREVRRPSEFWHTSRQAEPYQTFLRTEYEQFAIDPTWRHSDEETFTDVTTRAREALDNLCSLDGDVAVISHGHFIRHIVAQVATNRQLDGQTWQKMYNSFHAVNTGITTLEYDAARDHWHILTFNDIAHFAQ